jgi:hypothetical protein
MTAIIPTLAQRYNPAPADARKYEDAIARWYIAWFHWREAADLVTAVSLGGGDIHEFVADYNDCLQEYEHARTDYIRAKVWWRNAGRPW